MNSNPIEIVEQLLASTNNADVVRELVASDATYISLNYSNPDLKRIMPWCGTHSQAGPSAITDTFVNVARHWENKAFTVQVIFGSDEHVAVFGSMTYMARVTEKTVTSPFAIWCTVVDGKVTYMQFMEDTFMTASSFEVSGKKTYHADPDGHEVVM